MSPTSHLTFMLLLSAFHVGILSCFSIINETHNVINKKYSWWIFLQLIFDMLSATNSTQLYSSHNVSN